MGVDQKLPLMKAGNMTEKDQQMDHWDFEEGGQAENETPSPLVHLLKDPEMIDNLGKGGKAQKANSSL